MQLSEQQLSFFDTFGYLAFPELFNPQEISWIIEEFEMVLQTHGDGKNHDGSKRTIIVPTIDHSAKLSTLLDDFRILGIASGILGDDFNYGSGDGNYYSGDTGWHPDGGYPELFAIKLAFYLDPLTRDTGCLRVLPGSHRLDSSWKVSGHNWNRAQDLFGISPAEIPGNIALETNPGDLVVFNHSTVHAAFGGSSRRRMFTMNLHKHGHTEEEVSRVDEYIKNHCPIAHGFKIGGMYTDTILDTAPAERLKHLEQCHERHALVHPNDTILRPFPTL